jgi:hypothetical protein
MAAQRKFKLRADKYHYRAEASGQSQLEVDEIRGIENYCLQLWGQAAHERDELEEQLGQMTCHRDAALELAEERHQAWI